MLQIYKNKRVFITGHTGFKGSWLALWLHQLGAIVTGYSLPPPTTPSHYSLIGLDQKITSIEADVRSIKSLQNALTQAQPEILFHLAAQSLVLESTKHPKETFDTNVSGTVNVLEVARSCPSLKAALIITTDKCYENKGELQGYQENDRLGGKDPYSASKAMAELATAAYRPLCPHLPIATVRAGNVIGGGDFSSHRLIPDSIRALKAGTPIEIRHPKSVRPWLYILDALYGYLSLGERLLQEGHSFAEAWNFGGKDTSITVEELVNQMIALNGEGKWTPIESAKTSVEMPLLQLNWEKAADRLGWSPAFNWEQALEATLHWYSSWKESYPLDILSSKQITEYKH